MEELAKSFEEKAEKVGEEAGEKYETELEKTQKEASDFLEKFSTERRLGDTLSFSPPESREYFPEELRYADTEAVENQKSADLVCKLIGAKKSISSLMKVIDEKGEVEQRDKNIKTALPDTTLTLERIDPVVVMSRENVGFYLHRR